MINLQYCFPTAILSTINESLADKMLPVVKKYLTNSKFINDGLQYKTTYNQNNPGLEINNDIKPFVDFICKLGVEFLTNQGYKMNYSNFASYIFANEMYKGEVHGQHAHANSILSGVMYLQVPEGSSPIFFFDPRPRSKFIAREIAFPTETNVNEIHIQPQKGMILMWESWLEHAVLNNKNDNTGRISLVFNLNDPHS